MRKTALFAFGLFILLFTSIAGPVGAAEMREMPPRTEVPVNLRLVDEDNEPLAGEKMVTIEVTRGGLKEPSILTSGLRVKDGVAQFVYITPATPGLAEVRIIDPETGKVLESLVFYIIEPEPAARRDESFLVTQVTGGVEVQPGARLLRAGEKLVAGVTVTTAANSWLDLELFDGSRIIVQPGTVIRFASAKRGIAATGKEIQLTLVSGQIFVISKVFTEGDSLFHVLTPGAEIYASGRAFEVATSGKGTEAIVYQGELLMKDRTGGLLFPVAQGQKALLPAGDKAPRYSSHRLTAEMREDILQSQGFSTREEMYPSGTVPSGFAFRLGGSMRVVEEDPYTIFTLKPQFYNIADSELSLGLELPIYFDPSTGGFALYGGAPGVILGPFFDWIRFENETIFLDYGYVEEELTYGCGLLFKDYTSKYIRRTRLGVNVGDGLRIEVLAPWNFMTVSPLEFDSNSLYAIRLEDTYKRGNSHLQLGLSYVFDRNFRRDLGSYGVGIADQGVALDTGFFITKAFQPYAEVAALFSSNIGYGFEGGIRGEKGIFHYRVAGRYLGKGFHPNYFDGDYEINKLNTLVDLGLLSGSFYGRPLALLNEAVYKPGIGYYLSGGFTLEKILSFDISYADNNRADSYFPILSGKLEVTLPPVWSLPAVSAGLDFRCFQFRGIAGMPNADTITSNYIEVMLAKGVYATYKNTYVPNTDDYLRELILEVRWGK